VRQPAAGVDFVDPGTTDAGYNGGRSSCVAETSDPGSEQSCELSMPG